MRRLTLFRSLAETDFADDAVILLPVADGRWRRGESDARSTEESESCVQVSMCRVVADRKRLIRILTPR